MYAPLFGKAGLDVLVRIKNFTEALLQFFDELVRNWPVMFM